MNDAAFPKIAMARQKMTSLPIRDVAAAVQKEIGGLDLAGRIRPGERVAVTAGSRGIQNIDLILKEVVSALKTLGAEPFLFPAMGSHGGATAEGQTKLLAGYGITGETMGVSILATMETNEIGKTPQGVTVYADRTACQADHVVVVNRVKPHTKFKGPLESGLCKMMTIGMGKHKGAEYYHQQALKYGFPEIIEAVARVVMEKLPVLFGLAIVEDGYDQTAVIRAIPPEKIVETEKGLLETAKAYLPRLPFLEIDVLIIDRLGKEISGAGMDFNVIGRNRDLMNRWHSQQKIKRIFVRDLSEHSHGNGLGIGMADFTTERFVRKLDLNAMYINAMTASGPENAMLPIHFANDKLALQACLSTIGPIPETGVRLVWIRDTLSLERVILSESLCREAGPLDHVAVDGPLLDIPWDSADNLISPHGKG
jgi:hypothetical protein